MRNRATVKEMAQHLNVSESTVYRALLDHHNIGLGMKIKVRELAEKWNYQRNERAALFKQGKTNTIGVILPEFSESFFSTALSGIEDTAGKHNWSIMIGQSHDRKDREKEILANMKRKGIEGLIVSLAKDSHTYEHFDMLKRSNIPVVFFDRVPGQQDVHFISSNIRSGTIRAIDFLYKKNHKIIGMINGPEDLSASRERADGYEKGMRENGLPFVPGLIVYSDLTVEGTNEAMRRLLSNEEKPTAIVVFNDYVAMDAIRYARERKLRINKDISFVSYANLPLMSYLATPPLASVEQYPYEQGQKATETLFRLLSEDVKGRGIDTHYRIIIEPKLVVHKKFASV